MNNISFRARLIVDGDLSKSLKHSPIDKIINETKTLVEFPCMTKLLGKDEVILKRIKGIKTDGVMVKIGDFEAKIQRKSINPASVRLPIYQYACNRNNVKIRSGNPKTILDAFKSLLEKS